MEDLIGSVLHMSIEPGGGLPGTSVLVHGRPGREGRTRWGGEGMHEVTSHPASSHTHTSTPTPTQNTIRPNGNSA